MALHAYSLAKDGNTALSRNFAVREFRCRDGSDPVFVDSDLVELLQKIRDHFGKPVNINSAYRTAHYNNVELPAKGVKTSRYSQHLYGKAADIQIAGVPVETLAVYAETLLPDTGGIGRYHSGGFVHVDTRANKSRWKG